MGVDPLGLCREGVFYNSKGIPTGEVGLQSVIPTPDVRIGIDSPAGGVVTTLPFGSGGVPSTVQTGLSYNLPIAPGVNAKWSLGVSDTGRAQTGYSITTPIIGGSGSINSGGDLEFHVNSPQMNFPLGYGVNGYVGLQW
jgi:hypothetical protein